MRRNNPATMSFIASHMGSLFATGTKYEQPVSREATEYKLTNDIPETDLSFGYDFFKKKNQEYRDAQAKAKRDKARAQRRKDRNHRRKFN